MKHEKLIAIYKNHDDLEEALKSLIENGVDKEYISVVGKGEGEEPKDDFEVEKENEDIAYWGKFGAIWGAIWGFLSGAFTFWVPGFGPIVAAGPVIASLAGAVGGAAVIGSATAISVWLIDIGIEEIEAHRYEKLLKEGHNLLIVHTKEAALKAKEILEKLGKGEIKLYEKK